MIIPRFEIGQEVFIYEHGKLKCVTVHKIIIKITEEKTTVEYQFSKRNNIGMLSYLGTNEEEVFASREEFLNHV